MQKKNKRENKISKFVQDCGVVVLFKGKHHTEEWKAKQRERLLAHPIVKLGAENPMFGKHHSEETKAKIRAKKIGTHPSEETKAKLRIVSIGNRNAWKGDKAQKNTGNVRAIKTYPCPKGMERHHKDGNPLNNAPENIEIVTRKQHMQLDGRMRKLK